MTRKRGLYDGIYTESHSSEELKEKNRAMDGMSGEKFLEPKKPRQIDPNTLLVIKRVENGLIIEYGDRTRIVTLCDNMEQDAEVLGIQILKIMDL